MVWEWVWRWEGGEVRCGWWVIGGRWRVGGWLVGWCGGVVAEGRRSKVVVAVYAPIWLESGHSWPGS